MSAHVNRSGHCEVAAGGGGGPSRAPNDVVATGQDCTPRHDLTSRIRVMNHHNRHLSPFRPWAETKRLHRPDDGTSCDYTGRLTWHRKFPNRGGEGPAPPEDAKLAQLAIVHPERKHAQTVACYRPMESAPRGPCSSPCRIGVWTPEAAAEDDP